MSLTSSGWPHLVVVSRAGGCRIGCGGVGGDVGRRLGDGRAAGERGGFVLLEVFLDKVCTHQVVASWLTRCASNKLTLQDVGRVEVPQVQFIDKVQIVLVINQVFVWRSSRLLPGQSLTLFLPGTEFHNVLWKSSRLFPSTGLNSVHGDFRDEEGFGDDDGMCRSSTSTGWLMCPL